MEAHQRPSAGRGAPTHREEEIPRATEHAAIVAEIADMIARPGAATDEVLEAVVERAAEVVGGGAAIRVVTRKSGTLTTVAVHHVNPGIVDEMRLALQDRRRPDMALVRQVFETGEPLFLDTLPDDGGQAPPAFKAFIEAHVPRSVVVLPLMGHGEVVGLLVTSRFDDDTRPVGATDLAILTSLAERAAWAVEHDRLRAELADRADQQAAMAALGELALSGADEDSLLDAMIKTISGLLAADTVGWLEPTSNPRVLCARAGVGWPEAIAHDGRLLPIVPGGPIEHVLHADGPIIIDDHLSDARFSPSTALTEMGLRSSVLAVIGAPAIGIIGAHSKAVAAFTPSDADALGAAASMVSAALARGRAEKEVHRLAYLDAVTGLPNRLALREALDHAVLENQSTALLLMDLDRFKEVNDTLGHSVGDRLLREVGIRLRDAVHAGGVVGRLGGDEFAVVLPDVSREAAVAAAVRITHALRRPIDLDGIDLIAEASIGIALSPKHGRNGADLLQSADIAMYRAKRNDEPWSLATPEDTGADAERIALASDLRRGIEQGELNLLYQPMFDPTGGAVLAVEALVRWEHPDVGVLLPAHFIELAEHGGVSSRLTWWIVGTALNQVAAWRNAGLHLPVAVNLPPRVLHEPHLAERLADAADELGLDPASLTIELTEQAVMMTSPTVTENVRRLGELGVRVSIDNFGSGFSSLVQLHQLRVDEVKIDGELVAGMRTDPDQRTIVRTLCDAGHSLGMRVVAEGAESADDLRELALLGVDAAQGLGLAAPMRADEIVALCTVRDDA